MCPFFTRGKLVKSKLRVSVIAIFNKIKYEKGKMLTQERQYWLGSVVVTVNMFLLNDF